MRYGPRTRPCHRPASSLSAWYRVKTPSWTSWLAAAVAVACGATRFGTSAAGTSRLRSNSRANAARSGSPPAGGGGMRNDLHELVHRGAGGGDEGLAQPLAGRVAGPAAVGRLRNLLGERR